LKNMLMAQRDTFGNCQRPVFSLGVTQHAYDKSVKIWTQLVMEVARK